MDYLPVQSLLRPTLSRELWGLTPEPQTTMACSVCCIVWPLKSKRVKERERERDREKERGLVACMPPPIPISGGKSGPELFRGTMT
jgi:hypothetical protein